MTERQIVTKILRYLKKTYPGAFVWKINDRFMSGVPDILFAHNGEVVFYEVKTPTGELTKLQKYTITKLMKNGISVKVVRGIIDVVEEHKISQY